MPTKTALIHTEKSWKQQCTHAHGTFEKSTRPEKALTRSIAQRAAFLRKHSAGRKSVQNGSSNAPDLTLFPLLRGTFLSKHHGGSVSARPRRFQRATPGLPPSPPPVYRGQRARAREKACAVANSDAKLASAPRRFHRAPAEARWAEGGRGRGVQRPRSPPRPWPPLRPTPAQRELPLTPVPRPTRARR